MCYSLLITSNLFHFYSHLVWMTYFVKQEKALKWFTVLKTSASTVFVCSCFVRGLAVLSSDEACPFNIHSISRQHGWHNYTGWYCVGSGRGDVIVSMGTTRAIRWKAYISRAVPCINGSAYEGIIVAWPCRVIECCLYNSFTTHDLISVYLYYSINVLFA